MEKKLSEQDRMLKKDIGEICQQIIEEKKWRPFKDIDISVIDAKTTPFAAYITLNDRKIHINVSRDFRESVNYALQKNRIDVQDENAVQAIIYHLLVHEYNHHHYCPNSVFLFDEILKGIRKVVEKKECSESKIKNISFEISNMFTDTVINAIASHEENPALERNKYRLGQSLANILVLDYNCKPYLGFIPKKFDKALLLFAKSNMYLCDTDPNLYDKIRKYLPKFSNDHDVVKSLVDVFMAEPYLVGRIMDRRLIENDSKEIRARMCEYDLWRAKANKYAEIIYPYMKKRHDWLKNGFTGKGDNFENPKGDYQDQEGQEGSGEGEGKDSEGKDGKKGKGSGKKDEQKKDDKDKDKGVQGGEISQDDFDDLSEGGGAGEDQDDKDDPKPSYGIGGKGIGKGSGRYTHKDLDITKLDEFYKQRAGEIKLVSQDPNGIENLEVLKGNQDTDSLDTRRIDWPSTVLIRKNGRSYLGLHEKKFPLEIEAKTKENIGGLPDLCFVFDSSSSMGFDPWHEQGEYHIAVLTFYSILNNLEKIGVAPLLNYNAVNFSNVTFASDWHPYSDLIPVKKSLLSYQGGGTTLDVNELAKIRTQRKDSYVLFFLSDMGISNVDAVEKELVQTHDDRAAHVLLFKLGGRCMYSDRLEKSGIQIFYPTDANDFMNQSIAFTDKLFSAVK